MLERNRVTQQLQWSVWRTVLNSSIYLYLCYSLLLVRDVLHIGAVRDLIASRGELIVWHAALYLLVTGGPHPHDGRLAVSLQSVMSKDLTVIFRAIIVVWNNLIT